MSFEHYIPVFRGPLWAYKHKDRVPNPQDAIRRAHHLQHDVRND